MRRETLDRMRQRVERLCSGFTHYIDVFDKSNQFTGPSLYFHFRTIDRLRQHGVFSEVFEDDLFFEYLYATLTSWGLHRMGPGGAKLVDFRTFTQSVRRHRGLIADLYHVSLVELPEKDALSVAKRLWNILENIKVSESQTKLVANSKALHHLLPHTMPPIDREYTLRFFYNLKIISGRDEEMFHGIYPSFVRIGLRVKAEIQATVGRGFHTSETKVIDNAIVGFVLDELK